MATDPGVRSTDSLAADETGAMTGFFPLGEHLFPVDRAELRALDAAVRAALSDHRVVGPAAPGIAGALTGYVRERLPAFEAGLRAERESLTGEALAAVAAALGMPPRAVELPRVARTTLLRAAAKIAALVDLGVPDVVVDAVRARAVEAAAPGWRPPIDPEALVPDPVEVASHVDLDRWPGPPAVVGADISGLVLLAALCAVGPGVAAIAPAPAIGGWRPVGGEEADAGDRFGAAGAVVVVPVIDATVVRLEFGQTAGGGVLAVRLSG
ncbi:hypothetical protein ACQPZJ_29455 [Actinoplanes sp. CA-054009]